MKNNWNDWKNKLINSPNDIEIFEINQNKNCVQDNTVMEIITKNVSHIVVNKYLRILGTSNNMYENIIDFSNTFMENYEDGKYIVAHDVFGGLFASEKTIRYFSPDNLQWEKNCAI